MSALALALWAVGFLQSCVLLAILLSRGRSRGFPVFTAYTGYQIIYSIVLYVVFRYGSVDLYTKVYWFADPLDSILQICVIVEMTRIVLRPTGTWVLNAKRQFLLAGGLGLAFAAVTSLLLPLPFANRLATLEMRSDLFISLVVCSLVFVVTMTSSRLGLSWRNHVMALGQGWAVWALFSICADTLHAYFIYQHFEAIEHTRAAATVLLNAYWMIQFWRNEPARKPLPPEFQKYLQDLHIRVQSNLDTLEAQR